MALRDWWTTSQIGGPARSHSDQERTTEGRTGRGSFRRAAKVGDIEPFDAPQPSAISRGIAVFTFSPGTSAQESSAPTLSHPPLDKLPSI